MFGTSSFQTSFEGSESAVNPPTVVSKGEGVRRSVMFLSRVGGRAISNRLLVQVGWVVRRPK